MTAKELLECIYRIGGYRDIFIPEFTFGSKRIDALCLNTHKKLVRGYEIKTSRPEWRADKKWTGYSTFCDLLYVVCPEGLIQKEEIDPQHGLIWCKMNRDVFYDWKYIKRAKHNKIPIETYYRILELEMPRLAFDSYCTKCRCTMPKHEIRISRWKEPK